MPKYIATYAVSNDMGFGINEIDHSFDMVNFDVVCGDKVLDVVNAQLYEEFNEETEEYNQYFYYGAIKLCLDEFMRA